MRRLVLPLLLLSGLPALAVAQDVNARYENPAVRALSETRRLALLPNESVGFRILGTAEVGRTLRISTGHLREGRLYHAVARIIPHDGSAPLRAEGTVSADAPTIEVGALPAGEYTVVVHLEDYATGATRDARNKVVLR